MKRSSTSLVIREMRIKTTMQYLYTSARVARIKKIDYTLYCTPKTSIRLYVNYNGIKIKNLVRMWRACTHQTLLMGMKTVQPLWKTVGMFLRNLNVNLSLDSKIPFWEQTQENKKIYPQRHICGCSQQPLFIIAKNKTIQILINWWVNK